MSDGYTIPPLRTMTDDFKTYSAKQRRLEEKTNIKDKKLPGEKPVLELKSDWGYGNAGEAVKAQKEAKTKDLNINCKIQDDERDGQAGGIVFDISKLNGANIMQATHIKLHLKADKNGPGGFVSLEIHDDDNGDGKITTPYEKYYPSDAGAESRFKYYTTDDVWTAHKIRVNPGDDFVIYVPISAFLFNKGAGDNIMNLYHKMASEVTRISVNINAVEDKNEMTPLNIIDINPSSVFMMSGNGPITVPDAINALASAQDPVYGKDNNNSADQLYKRNVNVSIADGAVQLVNLPEGSKEKTIINRY